MNLKRQRSSSPPPTPSSSSAGSPTSKLIKTVQEETPAAPKFTCHLPPICAHKPTVLESARDLESHYSTYHSHVCEYRRCGCIFPDERLLELHFSECHDPITALKKERGEKTFACHLATCSRRFSTPKARRLHLIQAHGYPKQYFFAVTNKGIGQLLNKWGQAATLIRGEWKPRIKDHEFESDGDGDVKNEHSNAAVSETQSMSSMDCDEVLNASVDDDMSRRSPEHDKLADELSSLTLVPSKIRFGRGGKSGGFVRSRADKVKDPTPSEVNPADGVVPRPARGKRNKRGGKPGNSSGDPDTVSMQF